MSSRLMVVGSATNSVTQQVFEELSIALENQDAVGNVSEMEALSGQSLAELVKDPKAVLAAGVVSIRSNQSTSLLVKGLVATPAPSFDVLGWNLSLAASAGLAVVYALDASGMSAELISADIRTFQARAKDHQAEVSGVVLLGARGIEIPDLSIPVFRSPLTVESATALSSADSSAITPLAFQASLLARAGSNPQRIVLPEPEDPRILKATEELLAQGVAKIILIGEPEKVSAKATELGISLEGAKIVSTSDPELSAKYAAELARLRAAKGMTLEQAQKTVADATYFATMMVQMGDADGMVSGATHTTADTIRPAFQIIKTAPGTKLVSSSFITLLADRPVLFADCAVVVSPDAGELAQIALSTAATARAFGIDPRVAMLSYSTLGSGFGPSVDVVTEAVALTKAAEPELAVDGPLQFDAAFDPGTAAKKASASTVAGRANIYVFPDLNSGNIGYKIAQRTAGAVAVGPILQGLRKPVNDLSRGAKIEDIVNTVAITAVQAQAGGNN